VAEAVIAPLTVCASACSGVTAWAVQVTATRSHAPESQRGRLLTIESATADHVLGPASRRHCIVTQRDRFTRSYQLVDERREQSYGRSRNIPSHRGQRVPPLHAEREFAMAE
jgi:hypothetical protein